MPSESPERGALCTGAGEALAPGAQVHEQQLLPQVLSGEITL